MKNYLRTALLIAMLSATTMLKAQVPILSSYPSGSAVLFLDFDGHSFDNTAWNTTGPIDCAASGLDNTKITEIFNRVAEDYRPFALNVTTDSTKYWAAPFDKRMRVIISATYAWYGSTAGGVSFVGSFAWGDDSPCFVFSTLLNLNTKNISEAISHEAGHTLGLYHQSVYNPSTCALTSQYNYGNGTGEIGWAPIMGVGYYQNFTLWHSGPNPFGCATVQNDLDIITSNGFGYRPDDYAATFAGATNVAFTSNQFNMAGVIETNTDQDMIKFTQPLLGRFQLSAIPYNVGSSNSGSDLDLQVTLYNGSQVQLNVYNPGTLLSSVIDTNLAPGVYYLKIEGKGNVYAPAYASLGSYSLQANFIAGALPLHRLELRGQINSDLHQLHWIIDADEQVVKQVLEVSSDGRTFNNMTEPAVASRIYAYRPNAGGPLQYRLHVTFDNGRDYYSNIVTLRSTGNVPRPKLVSNLVSGSAVEVSSPGNFDYAVYDLNGKTLKQGKLENGSNNVTLTGITGGMYMVRFSNGTDQWIDKFVKQ